MRRKIKEMSWILPILSLVLIANCVAAVEIIQGCTPLTYEILTVKETATQGTVIAEINSVSCFRVTDSESPVSVTAGQTDNTWFLKVNADIDLEKTKTEEYTINCECCSRDIPDPYTLHLTVSAVNEFAPKFQSSSVTVQISEAAVVNSTVYSFIRDNPANDLDYSSGSTLIQYGIKEDADGRFVMANGLSGIVQLEKKLDYESQPYYKLNISAKEIVTTGDPKTAYCTLIILVQDTDDQNPKFTENKYSLHVPENDYSKIVTKCFMTSPPVKASDGDITLNAPISYALAEGNTVYKGLFSVNESGALCIEKEINPGVYYINIKAMQTDNPEFRIALAVINLTVTDTNNHSPVMSSKHYEATVSEDADIDNIILVLSATDNDLGNNAYFVFELDGLESKDFKIETHSDQGYLKVLKQLDREQKEHYSFEVYAKETKAQVNRQSEMSSINISVLDVNDNAPVFKPTANTKILENATKGTFLTKVEATDADGLNNNQITYSLLSSPSSNLFNINPQNGDMTLDCNDCLDYSDNKIIILIVEAQDNGIVPKTTLTSIPVQVVETDFAKPSFLQKLYKLSVPENGASGFLMQLQASDMDTPDSDLTYALADAKSDIKSMIHVSKNGSIFALVSFDAEKHPLINFDVSVTDGHNKDEAKVEITITDVNEFDPELIMPSSITINENSAIGKVVASVQIDDQDESNNGFTVWLRNGADGKFLFDSKSNQILLTGLLDRRIKLTYNISVCASDYGLPPRTSCKDLQVLIADSNSAPSFVDHNNNTVAKYELSVDENATVGSDIGRVYAVDHDKGSSGDIVYRIKSSTPNNDIGLEKDSGHFIVKSSLDYEKIKEYKLVVEALDNSFSPKSSQIDVKILVQDITEGPVWPSESLQLFLTQSAVCQGVSQPLNSDTDVSILQAKSDEVIEYFLLNMTNSFEINKNSGLLKNIQKLQPGSYVLSLEACGAGKKSCSETTVTVIVSSDSALNFCKGFYDLQIEESEPINTDILTLQVNKASRDIVFSIFSGNEDGHFKVDSKEGILKLAKDLDRETTNEYQIIVLAKSPSEEAKAQVLIKVLDVADSPPQFSASLYEAQVEENTSSNSSHILQISASDPDENSTISYKIDNNQDDSHGLFSIDNNGNIYLTQNVNFETMDSHLNHTFTFLVLATDGIYTSNASVRIRVLDVNDEVPRFLFTFTSKSVQENVQLPHELFQAQASDDDAHDRILYSMKLVKPQNTVNPFAIDPFSGQVEVRGPLDRENVPSYTVQLSLQDLVNHQVTRDIQIIITDVNDNNPTFDQKVYQMNVIEGSKGKGSSLPLQVTDQDLDENSRITLNIIHGNEDKAFDIGKNGTQFLLKTVTELKWTSNHSSIVLTIQAVDGGSSPKNGNCEVHVSIIDVNDHSPVFSSQWYEARILENSANDTEVILNPDLRVSDDDDGDFGTTGVEFSIVESNLPFCINKKTGSIFVCLKETALSLDREQHPNFNITIRATDDNGNGQISSATLTVYLEDVDDTAPIFTNSTVYEFAVPGDAKFGHPVGRIRAEDEDISTNVVFYTIENKGELPFALNFKTGELTVVGRMNARKYNLNISASDGIQRTFGSFLVNVTNYKDSCPFEKSNAFKFNISEHQAPNIDFGILAPPEIDGVNITYIFNDTEWTKFFTVSQYGALSLHQNFTSSMSNIIFDVYIQGDTFYSCAIHVELTVLRSNDFNPEICYHYICGVQILKFSLAENSFKKTVIGAVYARDNDTESEDQEINLSIDASSSLRDLISLDDGIFYLEKEIDISRLKEEDILGVKSNTISFNVTATDGGKPTRSTSSTVLIEILSSSSDIPVFTNSTFYMSVQEELQKNDAIGKVSVSSKYAVSYFISPTTELDLPFEINNLTGEISTTDTIDRERNPMYEFVVIAQETVQNKFSAAALVEISVLDINDNSPVFEHVNSSVLVKENEIKKNIYLVSAVDDDAGQNASLEYGFVQNYPEFSIDSVTGELSQMRSLDREKTPTLQLIIKAYDNGTPARTSTTTLSVIVEDVNDKPPVFPFPSYTQTIVLDNSTDYTHHVIIDMNAIDEDEGENGHIFYSLKHSGAPIFNIFPLTGSIYSVFPTPLIGVHNLTVTATDFGHPPLNSSVEVAIIVVSSYIPTKPTLTVTPTTVDLFVGMTKGQIINVTIDSENEVTLKPKNEASRGFLELKKNMELMLSKDLSNSTLYQFDIVAEEGNFTLTETLVLRVLPLQFDQSSYLVQVTENHEVPYELIDLNSVAERKSPVPVCYSLLTGKDVVKMNSLSGTLTLIKTLDREKVPVVTLTVLMELCNDDQQTRRRRATDVGRSATSISAEASVVLYVTDVNDNAPSFAIPETSLTIFVPGNSRSGYDITTLKAFDADDGDNKEIEYTIEEGENSAVTLDGNSGVLTLVDPGALVNSERIDLVVKACDVNDESKCDTRKIKIEAKENLVLPLSVSTVTTIKDKIMSDLASILEYDLEFLKFRTHTNAGIEDKSRSDLFFLAYDKATNQTVPSDVLIRQIANNQAKIDDIFEPFISEKKTSVQDLSETAAIALVAVACGMFVASFIGILVVCRLWKKQKEEQKKESSALRARKNAGGMNGETKYIDDPDEPLELNSLDIRYREASSKTGAANRETSLTEENEGHLLGKDNGTRFQNQNGSDSINVINPIYANSFKLNNAREESSYYKIPPSHTREINNDGIYSTVNEITQSAVHDRHEAIESKEEAERDVEMKDINVVERVEEKFERDKRDDSGSQESKTESEDKCLKSVGKVPQNNHGFNDEEEDELTYF